MISLSIPCLSSPWAWDSHPLWLRAVTSNVTFAHKQNTQLVTWARASSAAFSPAHDAWKTYMGVRRYSRYVNVITASGYASGIHRGTHRLILPSVKLGEGGLAHVHMKTTPTPNSLNTVSSHNFNSHNFNLRVSDPRTIAYFHFKMLLESSNLPGNGPILPD